MGNIINFPTPPYAVNKEGGSSNKKKQQFTVEQQMQYNFWRNKRYNDIVGGAYRDSLMAEALGSASRDIGGKRIRDRSEDDFMDIYAFNISEELSSCNNNFLKRVLHESSYIVDAIRKIRSKLHSGGITERESLDIGALKRELRSKLVKYLLLKEGFFDVQFQEVYENRELAKMAV